MPLDTYANLQTSVLVKLGRSNDSDAIARVVDWVTLAEDEMRMALTRLTVRQGESVNSAYTISSEYNALPDGFLRQRSIKITSSSSPQDLDYVAPQIADNWNSFGQAGLPKLFTIQGNQLRVSPPPDTNYTASFTYYSLPSLSVTNPTNWLLMAHPKLYFKATLAEAYYYYENLDRWNTATQDCERMLSAIYIADGSDQQGTNMRVRTRVGHP